MRDSLSVVRTVHFSRLIDWLYPPRCRFCKDSVIGRDEDCFCLSCREKILLVSHPLCPMCGRPYPSAGGEDHLCGICMTRPPYFYQARAWACYPTAEVEDHPLRGVIQRFKYGRKVSLGRPLGRLMARGCRQYFSEVSLDLILPVPLHPKRLRWRGFNQAVIFAREVGGLWRLPMDPFILLRSRETVPQTDLTEEERRKNVRGAFSLVSAGAVRGTRILLVDDVYTSGATINECSRILVRGGAKEVHVLTLARAVS